MGIDGMVIFNNIFFGCAFIGLCDEILEKEKR